MTVGSKRYPLGRILYGDTDNSIPSHARRHFQPAIRNFLMAQRVQAPIKLFSDWLNVGHIDEFMTFVPANSGKGFKLLLDSPHRCYSLLQKLQDQGKGALELRGGKRLSGRSAAISISKLLADEELSTLNDQFQQAIATNETILRRELGLDGGDILYLPMIFEGTDRRNRGVQRADSFFPNMVNMIVLGTHLAIPKPFGPIIDGVCQLEQMVRDMLEPEGLTCHFIDDWDSYFKKFGELHCGTNVKRRPSTFPWWQMALDS